MSHIEKKISWLKKYGKYAAASAMILAFSLIGSTQIKKVSTSHESLGDIDGADYWASSLINRANAQGGDDAGDYTSDGGACADGYGQSDDCGDAGSGGDCY